MNIKQIAVTVLMIVGIGLVVYFTPKYKIVKTYNDGFIIAEQGNPLYKNMNANEQFNYKKIIKVSVPILAVGIILVLLFKTKKKKIKIFESQENRDNIPLAPPPPPKRF